MNHRNLIDDAWVYSSNPRAEDGLRPPRGWRALRDTVLVPLGVFVVLLVLALFMSRTALAQTGSGRIAGSVKDATGAVISGSSVTLTNTATSVTQTTTSNEEGIFNFPVVSIGQYELDVTASGFTPYKQTGEIKIDVNTSLTIVGRRMESSFTFHPTAATPHRFGRFWQPEDSLRESRGMAALRHSSRQTADIFTTPKITSPGSGVCQLAAAMKLEYLRIFLRNIGGTGLCRRVEFITFRRPAHARP